MAENKVTEETTHNFLDQYGFATFAQNSQTSDTTAMKIFYEMKESEDTFASGAIAYRLNLAQIGKQQTIAKQTYDAQEKAYKTAPEDKRGEFKLKDPGQPDQALREAYHQLLDAISMYNKKRQDMIANLNPIQLLKYNSTPDGNPIIDIPEKLLTLLQTTNTPLKDLEEGEANNLIINATLTSDNYKINGIIAQAVARKQAEDDMRTLSSQLEQLAESE